MHIRKDLCFAMTALGLCASGIVQADTLTDQVTINGFASAGITWTNLGDDERYEPVSGIQGLNGTDLDTEYDSVAAVQFGYRLSDETRYSMQVLAKGQDSWTPAMEWAYISHKLTDDLTLRAGRLRLPVYMYSEQIDVGYTYPWVRPPVETYSILPATNTSGLDLLYHKDLGDWQSDAQLQFGKVSGKASDVTFNINNGTTLNISFSHDALTLRAGYAYGELSFNTPSDLTTDAIDQQTAGCTGYTTSDTCTSGPYPVVGTLTFNGDTYVDAVNNTTGAAGADGIDDDNGMPDEPTNLNGLDMNKVPDTGTSLKDFANGCNPLTDNCNFLDYDHRNARFYSIGALFDDQNWFFAAEFAAMRIDGWVYDYNSGYVTAGKYIGKFLPFASFAKLTTIDEKARKICNSCLTAVNGNAYVTASGFGGAAVPGGLAAVTGGPVTAPIDLSYLNTEQTTSSLGVRYEPRAGLDFKLQVDRVSGFKDTVGMVITPFVTSTLSNTPTERDAYTFVTFLVDVAF